MGILKRLFLFCLLLAGLNATINAAPSDNDAGQSAIQISVAYFQPAAILDAPDLQTADLSPDIGFFQTSNSNQNSTMDVSTRHAIKPNAAAFLFFSRKIEETANTAGRSNWSTRNSNATQTILGMDQHEGTTMTGATDTGDLVANSAKNSNSSITWTAHDYDTGAQNFYFFLSNNCAAQQSASAPDHNLRC